MNSTIAILSGQEIIDTQNDFLTSIILIVILCITLPLWYIYIYFSCIRYWLLFYSINWSVSCAKDAWHEIIQPTSNTKDWWIRKNKTYGSWNWIKKRLMIWIIICCIYSIVFLIIMTIYELNVGLTVFLLSIQLLLTAVLPLIICISIQCRIPSFDDNIGLREELKYCNYIFISIVIICFIYQIIYISNQDNFQNDATMTNIFWSSWFFILRFGIFFANLRQTRWPLKRFSSVLKSYSTRTVMDLAHQKTVADVRIDQEQEKLNKSNDKLPRSTKMCVSSPSLSSNSIRAKMRNDLKYNKIFQQFMQRLIKEHCAECLLSIIEMIQFQEKCFYDHVVLVENNPFGGYDSDGDVGKGNIINPNHNHNHNSNHSLESIESDELQEIYPKSCQQLLSNINNDAYLSLPDDDNFPKSSLVFKPKHLKCHLKHDKNAKFSTKDFKIIAKQIWRKYVMVDSEYEINIDGINRKKYRKIFENDDEWITNKQYNDYQQLCSIFNPCIEQMTGLITASFVNWVNSTDYLRLKKQTR